MSDKNIIVVIDTETTGLDPAQHSVWEIGASELVQGPGGVWAISDTVSWQITLSDKQIARAQAKALEVNNFHLRYNVQHQLSIEDSAARLAELTAGRTVACNIPTFDIPFLEVHLWNGGQRSSWNHRVIDIRSVLLGRLPDLELTDYKASLASLAYRIGYVQDKETLHTAGGDASWSALVLADILSPKILEPAGWEGTD